jgi:hypothetical protein
MTCNIGLSTTAFSSGVGKMVAEFGTISACAFALHLATAADHRFPSHSFSLADVVGQAGMWAFNSACACAPLFLAPLCEQIGRREVYISAVRFFSGFFSFVPFSDLLPPHSTLAFFTLIFLLLALSPNIGGEIVGRLLSGIFGSCGTILVGGTLADICSSSFLASLLLELLLTPTLSFVQGTLATVVSPCPALLSSPSSVPSPLLFTAGLSSSSFSLARLRH